MEIFRNPSEDKKLLQSTLRGFAAELGTLIESEHELLVQSRLSLREIYQKYSKQECVLQMIVQFLTIMNEDDGLHALLTSELKGRRELAQVLYKIVQEVTLKDERI